MGLELRHEYFSGVGTFVDNVELVAGGLFRMWAMEETQEVGLELVPSSNTLIIYKVPIFPRVDIWSFNEREGPSYLVGVSRELERASFGVVFAFNEEATGLSSVSSKFGWFVHP